VQSSTLAGRTPVIVGVGQVNVGGDDAPEPLELLRRAAEAALVDTGSAAIRRVIRSVQVVRIVSWRYRAPASSLAERLGVNPTHALVTTHGGQSPQSLVNHTAELIQSGQLHAAIIGGAESFRTRQAYRKRGELPPWPTPPHDLAPDQVFGQELGMVSEFEEQVGLRDPVHAYPLFEDALRAEHGHTVSQQRDLAAGLWSRFSAVATTNRFAAVPRFFEPEEIATPTPSNRLIGSPYTKLMNSNSSVNQAAALIVCSVEAAREAGISPDRWIYFHGGAEASEVQYLSNRLHLGESVALRVAGRALFRALHADVDDIEHLDLYSCFPSAVQVGARALDISLDRTLSVTGGLTFAGGPWNNYVSHSIAAMTERLRQEPEALGLCTANGGMLSKHALAVYSARPPARPPVVLRPQRDVDRLPRRAVITDFTGQAVVEARTVLYQRDGSPRKVLAACLIDDTARTWAASKSPDVLEYFLSQESSVGQVTIGEGGAITPGRWS
jgi:acetyl-CoA C-acetyltransferase